MFPFAQFTALVRESVANKPQRTNAKISTPAGTNTRGATLLKNGSFCGGGGGPPSGSTLVSVEFVTNFTFH
jgi:hypothetical protein